MLVGLWTIGSLAQRVASRPSAGLSNAADFSAPTWARPVRGQASATAQTPSAPHAASPMRGGMRCNIGGNS